MRIVLALLLFLFALPTASTQTDDPRDQLRMDDSGNNFLSVCSVLDKPGDQWHGMDSMFVGECVAYVNGIYETMSLYDGLKIVPHAFCPPYNRLQGAQLVRIVLKYLSEHPKDAHGITVALAVVALREAFPCESTK
jgi:hypothetical protein